MPKLVSPKAPKASKLVPPVPAKPGKPGAAVAAPKAPAAPIVDAPTARETALAAELASLKAEIATLSKAAAKAAKGPKARTPEEILEGGADLVPPDDWRIPYHGAIVWIKPFSRQGSGALKIHMGGAFPAVCAIPRDIDGSYGPGARAMGEIALHYRTNESGEYVGDPFFANSEEFGELWDDAKNG